MLYSLLITITRKFSRGTKVAILYPGGILGYKRKTLSWVCNGHPMTYFLWYHLDWSHQKTKSWSKTSICHHERSNLTRNIEKVYFFSGRKLIKSPVHLILVEESYSANIIIFKKIIDFILKIPPPKTIFSTWKWEKWIFYSQASRRERESENNFPIFDIKYPPRTSLLNNLPTHLKPLKLIFFSKLWSTSHGKRKRNSEQNLINRD